MTAPDKVSPRYIEAVPHSFNCCRPRQFRHGEAVSIVTEVEGDF